MTNAAETLMNESSELVPVLKFCKETIRNLAHEHEPLYLKHIDEVGFFKDNPPDMMWTNYFNLEDMGMLRTFSVRDAGSKLIGYAIYFTHQSLHHSALKISSCDMIYIAPEYRGGTGEEFIAWIDESLRTEGVNAVIHHVKICCDFGSMLKRLKYEHAENVYIRRFPKGVTNG